MKVAIREMSYPRNREKYPLSWIFKRSAEIGYEGVEVSVLPKGGLKKIHTLFTEGGIWPEEMSKKDRAEMVGMVKSCGIEIPTLSLDCCWEYSITDANLASRKKAIKIVRDSIELASDLGSKAILIHFGNEVSSWEQAKESISECAEEGENYGVKLGFESSLWERAWQTKGYYGGLETLLKMVEEINSEYFGVYVHSHGTGLEPAKEVEMIGNKLICVHLPTFLPRLREDVDWDALMESLKGVGYDWYIVFEVWIYPYSPDKAAADVRKQLYELMTKLNI